MIKMEGMEGSIKMEQAAAEDNGQGIEFKIFFYEAGEVYDIAPLLCPVPLHLK